MKMQMKVHVLALGLASLLGAIPAPLTAQEGLFAPVKIVNDQAISGYELRQRMQFLELLGQRDDLRGAAMDGLIEDRLRQSAAKAAGLAPSAEEVQAGMAEFAARANLSPEEFVTAIGQAGVAPETFRDFVASGVIWRQLVRARYGDKVKISEAAIDRALANFTIPVAQVVTLAEIVLPAPEAARSGALLAAREIAIDIKRGQDFGAAARQHSRGATAGRGGVLPPKRLSELPEDVAKAVRILNPGEVSAPMVLDDKVVIYQMIASADGAVKQKSATVVDYVSFPLPAGAAGAKIAADLRAHSDSCDDLYTAVRRAGAGQITRQTQAIANLPRDVAGVLALLDAGESSTALQQGGAPVFTMLCSRGAPAGAQASRDEVRIILTNQRLGMLSNIYLEELRSEALITDP